MKFSTNKPKLFIPGPTHVTNEVLEALGTYPVGHRTKAFSELYDEVTTGVQNVLFTQNRIFLGTCSATGFMEAAVRNSVRKRCANFICGAFSKRWHQITTACGIDCDPFEVEMGKAIKPEMVDEVLKSGKYDTITVVHNETSTGVMNPISDISEVLKNYPDVVFLVDMVSSMAGIKLNIDKLGIDVALASVQKAWGLPPGFAVCSVSERVLNRSKMIENKGYYFDFLVMDKSAQKSQTPTTPSIPHMYALKLQLRRIFDEGLDNRFVRHIEMAERVRSWATKNFGLFAEHGYESDTVTCITNPNNLDLFDLSSRLLEKGYLISGGYGPLKGKTFRIAHMGDLQVWDLDELLTTIDDTIQEMNT